MSDADSESDAFESPPSAASVRRTSPHENPRVPLATASPASAATPPHAVADEARKVGKVRKRATKRKPEKQLAPSKRGKAQRTTDAAASATRVLGVDAAEPAAADGNSDDGGVCSHDRNYDSDCSTCDALDIDEYEEHRRQRAADAGIENKLDRFLNRTFVDSESAMEAMAEYERTHKVCFRLRDTCTTAAWNKKRPGNKVSTDPKFKHRRFVLYCTHGCKQRSRSTGLRTHTYTRYTACPARVTFLLVESAEGWHYDIIHEDTTHNHNINPILYASYHHSKKFLDEDLFGRELNVLVQTGARPAQIATWLSHATGVPVTPQRARNVLASWLGGPDAEARMRKTLGEFLDVDGNRGALMQDEDGVTVGIITQSRMQAAMVKLYCDVLVCDVTYNTNDVGYKMGSLLVTGPTGRGIPVLDFLVMSETTSSLAKVLQYFKDTNEAACNVESFIVDKSMAEIGAIEAVFPQAKILLCQFHVKEAVGRALAQHRFALSLSVQFRVADLFSMLVYARRVDDYKARLQAFRDEIGPQYPSLLRYFEVNWFACHDMWSNVGRAVTFSCGNSTTNRVESNWTRIKAIIGTQTGVDRCLAALFQHQVTVFQKLQTIRALSGARTRTFIGVSNFLRPVAASISDYALAKVKTQLDYLYMDKATWSCTPAQAPTPHTCVCAADRPDTPAPLAPATPAPLAPATPAPLAPATPAPLAPATACGCAAGSSRGRAGSLIVSTRSGEYTVDRSGPSWTCTCFFYVAQRMPCQHMMYVSMDVLHARTLSRKTVSTRWNLEKLAAVDTILDENLAAMSAIPLPTLPTRTPEEVQRAVEDARVGQEKDRSHSLTKLRYVRVKKGARATDPLVLTRNDKRRMMRAELEQVNDLMVELSSTAFYAGVDQLRALLAPFVDELKSFRSTQLQPSSSEAADETDGTGTEEEGESWAAEFPPDLTDARECVRDRQEFVCPPDSDSDDDGEGEDDGEDGERDVSMEEVGVGEDSERDVPMQEEGTGRKGVEVAELNTDGDDAGSSSEYSDDHGFDPDSEPEQRWASSEHSSHDSVNYGSDGGGVAAATAGVPVDVALSANILFSPSQVSLPDLELSASSLAILAPLSGFSECVPVAPGSGASVAPASGASVVPASGAAVVPASGAAVVPASGAAVVPASGAAVVPASGAAVVPASGDAASASGAAVVPASGAAVVPASGAAVVPASGAAVVPASGAAASASGAAVVPASGAAVVPASGEAVVPAVMSASGAAVAPASGAAVAQTNAPAPAPASTSAPEAARRTVAVAHPRGAVSGRPQAKKVVPAVAVVRAVSDETGREEARDLHPVSCSTCGCQDFRPCTVTNAVICDVCGTPATTTSTGATPPRTSLAQSVVDLPARAALSTKKRNSKLAKAKHSKPREHASPEPTSQRTSAPAVAPGPATNLTILKVPKKAAGLSRKESRKKHTRRQIELELEEPTTAPKAEAAINELNFWAYNSPDVMEVVQKHSSYRLYTPARGAAVIVEKPLAPPYGMHPFTLDVKRATDFKSLIEDDTRKKKANGAPVDGGEGYPLDFTSDPEAAAMATRTVTALKVAREEFFYSSWYVNEVVAYHNMTKTLAKWSADRKWLTTLEPKLLGLAELFRAQQVGAMSTPLKSLLNNVRLIYGVNDTTRLNRKSLAATFQTPRAPKRNQGDTVEIDFGSVVGRIAGKTKLSDGVLTFLLNKVTEMRTDVVIIDPLQDLSTFKPPVEDIKEISFLVYPRNIGLHWILLVVEFDWSTSSSVGHVYDPVGANSSIKLLKDIFSGQVDQLVDKWLQCKHDGDSVGQTDTTIWAGPVQPEEDGWNCGPLCLLVAYFIMNKRSFPDVIQNYGSYSEGDMEVLRLKLLHLILVDSTNSSPGYTTRQLSTIDKVGHIMLTTRKNGP